MKRIYVAPTLKEYSEEQFSAYCQTWKRWKRNGGHYYMAPSIKTFSSWREKHLSSMAEVASQQERDANEAFVMALLVTINFLPKGEVASINSKNGLVEAVLYYELPKFLSLCLNGKREATFESFLNWAYQVGRGVKEISYKDWRKNVVKACRNQWKNIPRTLKKGGKLANGSVLYSTKEENLNEVIALFEDRLSFFKEKNLTRLAKKAAEELAALFGVKPAYHEYFFRAHCGL